MLSADRKEAAAFYTNAGTVEFLTRLTIRRQDRNGVSWNRDDIYCNHQMADLACGTGTLLRAGHNRIMALVRQAGGEAAGAFYRQAMERGIIGVDVSPIAAHLTASSLAMLGGNEPYGQTNIGWIGVGQPIGGPGRATTGALEYLAQDSVENFLDEGEGYGQAAGPSVIEVENDSIDWILMNPPYSRTRGGQSAFDIAGLTQWQRNHCQKRWGNLIKNLPAIKTAGMGASFLVLARQKVRPGGRIGFVLPLTAGFAESWRETRAMIERDFVDIIAIAVAGGHGAGELSAATKMNEMMLVATRKTEDMPATPSPVHCVTLGVAPVQNGIAGILAFAVESAVNLFEDTDCPSTQPVTVGEFRHGQIVRLTGTGQGIPWLPLGAVSASLCLFAWHLVHGRHLHHDMTMSSLTVPMTRIDAIFDVGPTHHLIGNHRNMSASGAFILDQVPQDRPQGYDRMLWESRDASQTCLIVDPTHFGTPRRGADPTAIRQTSSTLFYSRNLRWTSQRLVAASTSRPVMGGSSWVSLRHADDRVHKAASLWFNSLFGMIVQWARGQRTQQGRARNQINAVKGIPVPQLDHLSDEGLNEAVAFFDEISSEGLQRLKQASDDTVRSRIDAHVSRMMGLEIPQDELADWRETFCGEPSIRG